MKTARFIVNCVYWVTSILCGPALALVVISSPAWIIAVMILSLFGGMSIIARAAFRNPQLVMEMLSGLAPFDS